MDRIAPTCQPLAIERQDADHAAVMLGDVHHVVRIDVEERRTDQLGRPDLQQPAIQIEHLHTIVLSIGHQKPAPPVDPYAMRQVELSWPLARLTPREQIPGVRRELVHAGIAITVAHEHRTVRCKLDVRRQVERPGAMRHLLPRHRAEIVVRHAGIRSVSFDADGLQQRAVGGEFHELLVMLVGQPGETLRIETDCVRKPEQPRAPGRQEVAVPVEHHNGVLGDPIEAVPPDPAAPPSPRPVSCPRPQAVAPNPRAPCRCTSRCQRSLPSPFLPLSVPPHEVRFPDDRRCRVLNTDRPVSK